MKQQRPSRATIRAVAERAGVSIATVSRVVNGLHDKTGDATISRVLDAVAVLGYRTQSAGRTLRQRESRIVGVLVANLANPAMAAIAASIEAALRDAGYVMALCDTHEKPEIQDEYLAEMEAQAACGIVMVVAVPSPKLDALRAAGQPLVFVNRRDPAGEASAFVGIDDFAAGRELARYVAARADLRPVGLIHASLAFSAGALRAAGFQHGMAEFGIADVPYASYASANHLEIGYHGLGDLLARREPPRFVVCLSDLLAYGAYRRACEARLRVGEDIVFASFDDNPLNDWIAPWLSAIRIPFAAFGSAVVAELGELLAGQPARTRLLTHHLALRDGGKVDMPGAAAPIAPE